MTTVVVGAAVVVTASEVVGASVDGGTDDPGTEDPGIEDPGIEDPGIDELDEEHPRPHGASRDASAAPPRTNVSAVAPRHPSTVAPTATRRIRMGPV